MNLLTKRLIQKSFTPQENSSFFSNRQQCTFFSQKKEIKSTVIPTKQPIYQKPISSFIPCTKKIKKPNENIPPINKTSNLIKCFKKSVTMKQKNTMFKNGSKIVHGTYVKFRKGLQIYSFKCIQDNAYHQQRHLTQDHDYDTDDEQIFIAQKTMFVSLCQSLEEDIFQIQKNINPQDPNL